MTERHIEPADNEDKTKCGPGTHYDPGTDSCVLDEEESTEEE